MSLRYTAVSMLAGALSLLKSPQDGENAGTAPHSSDEVWEIVMAAARDVRRECL